MKIFFYLFVLIIFSGCVSKDLKSYKVVDLNDSLNINWYKSYNQASLNNIINKALLNNIDLLNASLNINKALIRANILKADLYPTLSFDENIKFLKDANKNPTYDNRLLLSYEIDLFGKIRDRVSAKEWEARASVFDLYATKLSIINTCINSYFGILYNQNAIKLLNTNLKNLYELENIQRAKFNLGKSDPLALDEVKNTILNLKNKISSFKIELDKNMKLLKEIAKLDPSSNLNIPSISILEVINLEPNLNIPYDTLFARPDLKEKISIINARFFDKKASFKDFFPKLTLSSSLSSAGGSNEAFKFNIFSTNLGITLPFLDFYRLNQNKKLSEIEFKKAVLDYEDCLNKALNEVYFYYKAYKFNKENLNNIKESKKMSLKISNIYLAQFKSGKNSMKNYLDAQNKLIDVELNLIKSYFDLLSSGAKIFEAMGARL